MDLAVSCLTGQCYVLVASLLFLFGAEYLDRLPVTSTPSEKLPHRSVFREIACGTVGTYGKVSQVLSHDLGWRPRPCRCEVRRET